MASRRTRIKGIANIPQRRKTGNACSTNPEDNISQPVVPEIDQQNGDSNLNSVSVTTEIKANTELTTDELSNNNTVTNTDNELNQKVEEEPVKVPEQPPTSRRKFIRPHVSVNAINRKPKEVVGIESKEQRLPLPTPTLKEDKSKEIVILSQFITVPNQATPISSVQQLQQQNGVAESPTHTSENEYPVPPPSPSKVNRSRIKAVPRLGQRNTSFSASESEDEARRNYHQHHRIRNDSVCSSTTSGVQDTSSIPECPSPQKPKEFNILIQRKCRRTEQSRKLAEARRDFYMKFGNNKPDRQKLTMIDLIFYNPTTNLMSHETKKKDEEIEEKKLDENEEEIDEPTETPPESTPTAAEKSGSDEENEIPAPQIKIGPQGELIVDEQSLVIENKAVKKSREELQKSNVIDGDFETSYGLYKRAKRSKDWNKQETIKFYKALNTIGTDFTLMCDLFPRRTRRELKMKFKKEERINRALVDRAIMQPCGFDFNELKDEVDMEEEEQREIEKQKEREMQARKEDSVRKRKISSCSSKSETPPPPTKIAKMDQIKRKRPKTKKKKQPLDILNVLSDGEDDQNSSEDDADVSDFEHSENIESQSRIISNMQKPTRSGRVPKLVGHYRPKPAEPATTENEPGSLMVMASTGQNGEPVYNVYMVTGDQKMQIGSDISSLKKAVEFKENCNLKSLFTLSTTPLTTVEEEEEKPVEENNITIPANEVLLPI